MNVKLYRRSRILPIRILDRSTRRYSYFYLDFGCTEYMSLLVNELIKRVPEDLYDKSQTEMYSILKPITPDVFSTREFTITFLNTFNDALESIFGRDDQSGLLYVCLATHRFAGENWGIKDIHTHRDDFQYYMSCLQRSLYNESSI